MITVSFVYQPPFQSSWISDNKNQIKSLQIKKRKITEINDCEKMDNSWLKIVCSIDKFVKFMVLKQYSIFISNMNAFYELHISVTVSRFKKFSEQWVHFVNLIFIQFSYHRDAISHLGLANNIPQRSVNFRTSNSGYFEDQA